MDRAGAEYKMFTGCIRRTLRQSGRRTGGTCHKPSFYHVAASSMLSKCSNVSSLSALFTAPRAVHPNMPPRNKTPTKSPQPSSASKLLVDDIPADVLAHDGPSGKTSLPDTPANHVPNGAAHHSLAYPLPTHISRTTINNTESLLRFVILALISGAAIGSRLFAVIRFESVIHELCVALCRPSGLES